MNLMTLISYERKNMRYCFDIDNTICLTKESDYENSQPKINVINKINELYDKGNYIIIMTARGASSGIDWEKFTKQQLKEWKLKYHELICNRKPNADFFVDDKAINIIEWEKEYIPKKGIVFGAFDLIHPGYIRLFDFCKQNCTHLTIALHENPNIQKNNKKIPILSIPERIEILNSIKYIDNIITYRTEQDVVDILKNNNYDIRFLGSDYKDKLNDITGFEITPIIFHDRNHEWSYTKLRNILNK